MARASQHVDPQLLHGAYVDSGTYLRAVEAVQDAVVVFEHRAPDLGTWDDARLTVMHALGAVLGSDITDEVVAAIRVLEAHIGRTGEEV